MKSFAVIALVGCFLGVMMTCASSGSLETQNQEDESKLRVPEEAFDNDEVDKEDDEDESKDAEDDGDDPER